ncbi:putative aldehyde reductase [Atractiella rhizophila]|nr:putative aldehyde reductase [Atractiella rhizophila]
MSKKAPLEILFGGGSIGKTGWINTLPVLDEVLSLSAEKGCKTIDCAFIYSPGAPTTSESLIGEWKAQEKRWVIDTKANSYFKGAHTLENLRRSLESSLERLKVKKVRIFYLHVPDRSVPLLETLEAVNTLYEEGKFEKFGVSNFSAEEVEELVQLAQQRNLVKLSVYQGQYNGLARNIESQLLPLLRKHGIAFFAYSPTAGGFFQEKHILEEEAEGRFSGSGYLATAYKAMYQKPAYFRALKEFHATLRSHSSATSSTEIATRWIVFHSALKGELGDGVILGTNKKSHLVEGMAWVEKGPLETWAVEIMEKLWSEVQEVAPHYSA